METIVEIYKGIEFKIQTQQLPSNRVYIATLSNDDMSVVQYARIQELEDGLIVLRWTALQTKVLPDTPLTLDIYDENREVIYQKKKFAIAIKSSAVLNLS